MSSFGLMIDRIRVIICCGSARHGKVNVSHLGQSKRGHYLELDLPSRSRAETREMNLAVGDRWGDV